MVQAQGSRHSVSYVAESTFGTTPSTPSMIELPNTGTTLAVTKDGFASNTIRNDRQINDFRHGVKQIGGDVNFEMAYGQFDDLLEGALFGAWSSNVLKSGVTSKSFTIERAFADISEYQRFTGCMVNTMSLNITPNAMVTGSFGIIGKDMAPASSALDAAITAAPSNPPMDGFTGSISEAGSAVNNVTALTLSLTNNLNPAFVVGSDVTPQVLAGQSNLTGNLTAFFESEVLLNKFLSETETSVSVTMEGASGGDITILVPRLKYTEGTVEVSSSDEGILVSLGWQAMLDSTEATNLKITRVPA